jgi:hypothetical protein
VAFLTKLVPGIDTGFFLALTIAYALVLSLAPLIYTAKETVDDGHTSSNFRNRQTSPKRNGHNGVDR